MSKGQDGPAANSFTSPRKSGWLTKHGGHGIAANWKKRWFVLDNCYLFYYKGQNDKRPVGVVALHDYRSCRKGDTKESKKSPFTFVIEKRDDIDETEYTVRNYIIFGDSDEDIASWMRAIEVEIKGAAPSPSASSHDLHSPSNQRKKAKNKGKEVQSKQKKKKGEDPSLVDDKAFDELTLKVEEGPKLTHLTADRPRVKHRRPPRKYVPFNEDDKEDEEESTKSEGSPAPHALPESTPTEPKRGHQPATPLKPKPSPLLPRTQRNKDTASKPDLPSPGLKPEPSSPGLKPEPPSPGQKPEPPSAGLKPEPPSAALKPEPPSAGLKPEPPSAALKPEPPSVALKPGKTHTETQEVVSEEKTPPTPPTKPKKTDDAKQEVKEVSEQKTPPTPPTKPTKTPHPPEGEEPPSSKEKSDKVPPQTAAKPVKPQPQESTPESDKTTHLPPVTKPKPNRSSSASSLSQSDEGSAVKTSKETEKTPPVPATKPKKVSVPQQVPPPTVDEDKKPAPPATAAKPVPKKRTTAPSVKPEAAVVAVAAVNASIGEEDQQTRKSGTPATDDEMVSSQELKSEQFQKDTHTAVLPTSEDDAGTKLDKSISSPNLKFGKPPPPRKPRAGTNVRNSPSTPSLARPEPTPRVRTASSGSKEEKEKEEAEKARIEQEEKERIAKEESERKAKEESERKAKEESERKAREEEERRVKEEQEKKAREEEERIAREEAERKANEEKERIAKEMREKEEERLRVEEEERLRVEEEERKLAQMKEEEERKLEMEQKEEEERKRNEEKAREVEDSEALAKEMEEYEAIIAETLKESNLDNQVETTNEQKNEASVELLSADEEQLVKEKEEESIGRLSSPEHGGDQTRHISYENVLISIEKDGRVTLSPPAEDKPATDDKKPANKTEEEAPVLKKQGSNLSSLSGEDYETMQPSSVRLAHTPQSVSSSNITSSANLTLSSGDEYEQMGPLSSTVSSGAEYEAMSPARGAQKSDSDNADLYYDVPRPLKSAQSPKNSLKSSPAFTPPHITHEVIEEEGNAPEVPLFVASGSVSSVGSAGQGERSSFTGSHKLETFERDGFGYTKVNKKTDSSDPYSWMETHMTKMEEQQPSSVTEALQQAREILRLARVARAEAEEMKKEAERELALVLRDKHDAQVLKKNAEEILRMAKEKLKM